MKLCDYELSRELYALEYDGGSDCCWVKAPHCDPRLEHRHCEDYDGLPDGTDLYPAPRLDDAAYWLERRFGIMVVIEPFIYNGTIYNYIPRIYSPYLLDGPAHMDGIEVRDGEGRYFLEYGDGLEAVVRKAVTLAGDNISRFYKDGMINQK